jgi:hypothetical protein
VGSTGFRGKWVSWIRECISTTHLSVLIIGSPSNEFFIQKGIRKGDLMSSFLFNIVIEGLTILFRQAMESGLYFGVQIYSQQATLL